MAKNQTYIRYENFLLFGQEKHKRLLVLAKILPLVQLHLCFYVDRIPTRFYWSSLGGRG